MRVIFGGRCTGKTTKLIKHASETGSIIVAGTTAEKRHIQEKANRMYDVKMITNPYICVVVPSELKSYGNDVKVVVDNAEYVLQNLLGCQIDAITINKETLLRGMNHPVIVTSENPYETEQPEERIKSLEERVNWLERQLRNHCAIIDKEQVTKHLERIVKNYISRRDDPDETEEHMAEDIAYELEIFVDELKAMVSE